MKNLCPCCGRSLPKAKAPIELSDDMTTEQRFAYYKRLAPVSDLAFTRRNASPELQAAIDAIVNPTAKDAAAMRERRRVELAETERVNNVPAVGSHRWFESLGLRIGANGLPEPADVKYAAIVHAAESFCGGLQEAA